MASKSDVLLTPAAVKNLNQAAKRPQNPADWKITSRKKNKQSGNPYKGKNNQLHPGILPPGDDKICGRCYKDGCKLDGETKRTLFTEYRSTDQNGQYSILAGCISVEEPELRKVPASLSQKQNTYKYMVPHHGHKLDTCKATLMNIFGITAETIRTVTNKMKSGYLRVTDERGKHDTRPTRISEDKHRAVVAHVSSFPTIESHYTRKTGDPDRLYLYPELNASKMYDLYIEQQRENDHQDLEVEEWYYCHILNTEFKLKFSKPKQDTCDRCDEFKHRLIECQPSERATITAEFLLHKTQADLAYQSYKRDSTRAKTDPSYLVLTGDLEQIFFTPGLRNSSSFYLRKLSNFNFGIHNAADNSGTMNLWSEITAKRGSNEITSSLWKYLTQLPKLQVGEQRELVIWVDRCRGQNNNYMFITMLMYLVWENYFTTVNQKLFLTGHSFNDCDRTFGTIEKKLRSTTVLVPADIESVISQARTNNPFTVQWLAPNEVLDFKFHSEYVPRPRTLFVTQSLWYQYSRTAPQHILSRPGHRVSVPWTQHEVLTLTGQLMTTMSSAPTVFRRAYDRPNKLDAGKVRDIRKLMRFLSGDSLRFYQDLLAEQALLP